jgi:hypothetical protein
MILKPTLTFVARAKQVLREAMEKRRQELDEEKRQREDEQEVRELLSGEVSP